MQQQEQLTNALRVCPVVIPCFNEEESLGELHRRVTAVCARVLGDAYEILLVDDGSIDLQWADDRRPRRGGPAGWSAYACPGIMAINWPYPLA